MPRSLILSLAVACAAAVLPIGAWAQPAGTPGDPTGLWKTHHDHRITIFHCGEQLCAQVASLSRAYNADGSIRRDVLNPNPALRARPIIGAPLFENVVRTGPAEWKGRFYYPEGGAYFEGTVTMDAEGAVNVNACGKTGCEGRHWTRVH